MVANLMLESVAHLQAWLPAADCHRHFIMALGAKVSRDSVKTLLVRPN